jgi:hypothetical protein
MVEIKCIKKRFDHGDRDKPTYLVTNKSHLNHGEASVYISSFDDIVLVWDLEPTAYFKQLPHEERLQRIKNIEISLTRSSKYKL